MEEVTELVLQQEAVTESKQGSLDESSEIIDKKAEITVQEPQISEKQEGKIKDKFIYDWVLVPNYILNLKSEWIQVDGKQLKVNLSESDLSGDGLKEIREVAYFVNQEIPKHNIEHFVAVLHLTNSKELCYRVKNSHIHIVLECTKYPTEFVQNSPINAARRFLILMSQNDDSLGARLSEENWRLRTCYLNYPERTLGLLKQSKCMFLGCSSETMESYWNSIKMQKGAIKMFHLPKGSHVDKEEKDVDLLKARIKDLESQIEELKSEKKKLESENVRLLAEKNDLQSTIEDLVIKNDALIYEVDKLKSSNVELNGQVQQLVGEQVEMLEEALSTM